MNNAKVSVLVTGITWVGSGIRSIDGSQEDLIREAKQEIVVITYGISNNAVSFVDTLGDAAHRGIQIKIIIDNFKKQPAGIRNKLLEYSSKLPNFQVFSFLEHPDGYLHAKVLVADRKRAIVGSSNLSWRGLVTNHELAVLVEGRAVKDIASAVDRIINQGKIQGRVELVQPTSSP